jgi:hypothetical protein
VRNLWPACCRLCRTLSPQHPANAGLRARRSKQRRHMTSGGAQAALCCPDTDALRLLCWPQRCAQAVLCRSSDERAYQGQRRDRPLHYQRRVSARGPSLTRCCDCAVCGAGVTGVQKQCARCHLWLPRAKLDGHAECWSCRMQQQAGAEETASAAAATPPSRAPSPPPPLFDHRQPITSRANFAQLP